MIAVGLLWQHQTPRLFLNHFLYLNCPGRTWHPDLTAAARSPRRGDRRLHSSLRGAGGWTKRSVPTSGAERALVATGDLSDGFHGTGGRVRRRGVSPATALPDSLTQRHPPCVAVGVAFLLPACAGICPRLLAFVGVCWCLLVFAGIFRSGQVRSRSALAIRLTARRRRTNHLESRECQHPPDPSISKPLAAR